MKKIFEDDENVSYEFNSIVVDKEYYEPGETFLYKVGTCRGYGYCVFSKKTEELTLDKEKTHPFYVKHRAEVGCVWLILLKILKSGEKFPERTSYGA